MTGRPEKRLYDSVAVFSGGLDSTTLVYEMMQQGLTPHLLSFDYGQRHRKELDYAAATGMRLGLRHDIVNLSGITHLISNSALTSQFDIKLTNQVAYIGKDKKPEPMEVPEGHYAEDNMKQTVVPNRNMIMLSIAAAVMVNNSYRLLGTGVHAGDHFVYPDCRPEFLTAANASIILGNQGFGNVPVLTSDMQMPGAIYAPFVLQSKADIAATALTIGVPLNETWSCYKGGSNHCGKCGTCVERLEAIDQAHKRLGLESSMDATLYDDSEYWKSVVTS
jgi:7-cyano-7-deazaguanine synthase